MKREAITLENALSVFAFHISTIADPAAKWSGCGLGYGEGCPTAYATYEPTAEPDVVIFNGVRMSRIAAEHEYTRLCLPVIRWAAANDARQP